MFLIKVCKQHVVSVLVWFSDVTIISYTCVIIHIQGGEATTDEMCLSFAVYYPRTQLSICTTIVNTQNVNIFQPFATEFVPRY